ncbi:hypothetical protein DH2020_048500 [Rehmannia glutinosa]|uniref:Protein kinase domain-containing protein n=1 Tax=Rehmannia glutinosa TaxID=99300 RepID=A0ABR0U5N9_REHGL
MPSCQLLSPPPPDHHLLPPLAGGLTAAFSCLLFIFLFFRRIKNKPTAPPASDKKTPHRLSYAVLRRATANFSPSLRLGRGGFGSVYRADLNPIRHVAVKLMDSASLQGEREFQSELLFSSKIDCKYIVSVMGFSSNPRKRRMILVYELMENGSLQDCLFRKQSDELKIWDKRFLIALSIARGLEYLHHYCDPPIIHGDIKPGNILLDAEFNAKISDFGLARFKVEKNDNVIDEVKKNGCWREFEEINDVHNLGNVDSSPESVVVNFEVSPETVVNDYLMDWEIQRAGPSPRFEAVKKLENEEKKKRGRLDWWMSMDDEKTVKKEKRRSAMKNERVNESTSDDCYSENSWPRDNELYIDRKNKRSRSRSRSSSGDSIDSWLDGICGELRKTRKHSYDISSTPSMRGTICYVAPEYNGGDDVSEKCDVYSYGVLLLVLISGRRPLQVNGSQVLEFKRANLLSWSRCLARSSKLLDLVDQSIRLLDEEQALLCVSVALLCLQKSPPDRPSMKEVVGMLSGDLERPQLPVEFLPATPSRFPFKSHKKGR